MVCSRYQREFKYYEEVLKRKCLRKLKSNVWENKTKWRLTDKADFYFRLKLLQRCMNSWMTFTKRGQEKKRKMRAAASVHEDHLRKMVLTTLRRNVELAQMFSRVARNKIAWKAKYRAWHQWKLYTQKRIKIREIKLLANRIREERLIVNFFYVWSFRLKEKIAHERDVKKIFEEYEIKIKRRYFNLWKTFKNRKNCKKKIRKLSMACWEDKLLTRVFRSWRKYTTCKRQYQNRIKFIQSFYENYRIISYLYKWLILHSKFQIERDINNFRLAVNFQNRKLLKKGLKAFRNIRDKKQEKRNKMSTFQEHRERIYLSFYINLWEARKSEKLIWKILEGEASKRREIYLLELFLAKTGYKYRERIEEREQFAKIVDYSNAMFTNRVFKKWIDFTNEKINKKMQAERAREFYLHKLTNKFFERWKKFLHRKFRKNEAMDNYTRIITSRCINRWKIFLMSRRLKQVKAIDLKKKYQSKLLRRTFNTWINEVALIKKKLICVTNSYNKSLSTKVFIVWRKTTQMKVAYKIRLNRNKNILNSIIIKHFIFRWRETRSIKQTIKKRLEEAKRKGNKRSKCLYITIWRTFVLKKKDIRHKNEVFSELKFTILIEQYLKKMLKEVKNGRLLKKKEKLAKIIQEKIVRRKFFRKWKASVQWKKNYFPRYLTDQKVDNICPPLEPCLFSRRPSRKKPIVPNYLKKQLKFNTIADETSNYINEETFTVPKPINKKLPVANGNGTFVFFDF